MSTWKPAMAEPQRKPLGNAWLSAVEVSGATASLVGLTSLVAVTSAASATAVSRLAASLAELAGAFSEPQALANTARARTARWRCDMAKPLAQRRARAG